MLIWLLILIPIVEIYLLIEIGSVIGALPTVLLILLTAAVGLAMLKVQGLQTLMRFQRAAAEGRVPAAALMEGVVILISGALLLTPGFATDAAGFLGLLRPSRLFIIRMLLEHGLGLGRKPPPQRRDFIEGKFRRRDND